MNKARSKLMSHAVVIFSLLLSLAGSAIVTRPAYALTYPVTVSRPPGQADPTNSPTIQFKVSFGAPIDDATFDYDDIITTNTDSVSFISNTANQDYVIGVHAVAPGAVTLRIPANAVTIASPAPPGSSNDASNTLSITYSITPSITNISPNSGPVAGGTSVTLTGSNLISGTATFGGTSATCTVNSATQLSCVSPAHAAGAVDVVVTTPHGTATSTGGFTYLSSEKELTDYAFWINDLDDYAYGVFTGNNIAVTVPYRNVTALVAEFQTTGVTVTVGATQQESGVTPNNFTNPVIYTVTAEDRSTQNYTVTVTLGEAYKEITDFDFYISGNHYYGDISETDVGVLVPQGADLTALVANFSTSDEVSVRVGNVAQISGITPNDFTNPVIYTVVGGDNTTRNYTVTVGFQSWNTRTTANGLGGNIVRDVAVNGSTIYAATSGGLSISTDNGITFTNKTTANGLGSNSLNGIFVNGSTVMAGTFNGLSVSTDGGSTFTNKTTANGLGDNIVLGVFASGANVYAGTGGGLSISTDNGITFTNKTTADGLGHNFVYNVYVSGSTVYAATNGGLSISTNGGVTFTNKTFLNGLGSNSVMNVYANGSTVYAATSGGLSISTDGGATFINKNSSNGLSNYNLSDLFVNGSNLYLAAMNGATISPNGGVTFTNYRGRDGVGNFPSGVAANTTTVFVATYSGLCSMPLPASPIALSPSSAASFSDPANGFTIVFPAGAVTTTTTVTYTNQVTTSHPTTGFKFAGKSFSLTGANANGPVTQFAKPYTLTIDYQDSDWQNAGIGSETSLNLFYYDTVQGQWKGILPCANCALDTAINRLTVVLDHFTDFALMAKNSYTIFLPAILR